MHDHVLGVRPPPDRGYPPARTTCAYAHLEEAASARGPPRSKTSSASSAGERHAAAMVRRGSSQMRSSSPRCAAAVLATQPARCSVDHGPGELGDRPPVRRPTREPLPARRDHERASLRDREALHRVERPGARLAVVEDPLPERDERLRQGGAAGVGPSHLDHPLHPHLGEDRREVVLPVRERRRARPPSPPRGTARKVRPPGRRYAPSRRRKIIGTSSAHST